MIDPIDPIDPIAAFGGRGVHGVTSSMAAADFDALPRSVQPLE